MNVQYLFNITFKQSLCVIVMILILLPSIAMADILNGNFESGLNGWTVTTHYNVVGSLSTNTIGDTLPYGTTITPGIASYSSNTITGASLDTVFAGNYSAKLFSGYGEDKRVDWTRIQQTASVPMGMCVLEVYLAMVLPGFHTNDGSPNEDPNVVFNVLGNGGAVLFTKTFSFGDKSLAALLVDGNQTTSTASGGPFKFLPWTRFEIDLSAFNGKNITIAFTANKCLATAHFSYAYIDNVRFLSCYTPTITRTSTKTRTPTRTYTPTATPTKTYTPTFTNTFTVTNTPTYTVSKTFTPTYTPSFTVTDTATFTATKTFTPTYTPTFTITFTRTFTPTLSPTVSRTNTPTITDTFTFTSTRTFTPTYTATPTFTNTRTFTPTFTATPTFTPTFTVTATFTDTSTRTYTKTFTPTATVTNTPTYTMTFTATRTITPTYTSTFTYTATSTFTNTKTFTPTYTFTNTRTFTPTFTVTFTQTASPTFSLTSTATYTITQTRSYTTTPTPVNTMPIPGYLIKIRVYNEAGEVVCTIAQIPSYNKMTGVITDTNGVVSASSIGFGGQFNILIPGVGYEGTDVNVSWNAKTDAGQYTASGPYSIRIDEIDTYGRDRDTTIPVTVIRNETYIQLNIFNSAGELVRSITNYDFVFPPNYVPGPAKVGVSMDVPPLIITNKGGISAVEIRFGSSANELMLWDGKNNFGMAVSSGVYETQIVIKTELLLTTIAASNITVLQSDGDFLSNIKAFPNPYDGTGPGIELRWDANEAGNVVINIYNITGELVRVIHEKLENKSAKWDMATSNGNQVSNGLYIAVLQGISSGGYRKKMKVKLAVNRRTDPYMY